MSSDKQDVEEKNIREKIKRLGKTLGFEVEENWTPTPLKSEKRTEVYIPQIDVVWYKTANQNFTNLIHTVCKIMRERMGTIDSGQELGILPIYCDISKEIVIGFEIELTDRPTKYILGDIANLSRICDYGFIIIRNIENLVKRSIKASRAFSLLHGASRVFIIGLEDIDRLLRYLAEG